LRCGVLHRAAAASDVTVAGANCQVRLINADLDLSALAGLRSALRVIAERVLPAQLVGDICKGAGKVLG
jgi:hypothetical protein